MNFYGVDFMEGALISTFDLVMLLHEKEKEIENLKRQLEDVKLIADRDSLTNVLNRRAGMDTLVRAIEQCNSDDCSLSVMFLDVDNFKKVNDSYGHVEGDNLLLNLVKILKASIRSTDIIFRIGGDEFVIIFPTSNKEHVKKICNRILKRIRNYNDKDSSKYNLGISFGIAKYNSRLGCSVRELLDIADREMYRYKSRKKKENSEKCGNV